MHVLHEQLDGDTQPLGGFLRVKLLLLRLINERHGTVLCDGMGQAALRWETRSMRSLTALMTSDVSDDACIAACSLSHAFTSRGKRTRSFWKSSLAKVASIYLNEANLS